jgi:lipopolysaccharide export system permease protein
MVFTLHRYIFRELFRIFILATITLTGILSLGSILRPIQEYGIGPGQVLHLLGYFLPIMLTFVLPIAALFAASLVYGRFASDNELDACRASGISFMTLVYPGIALAVMVAMANLLLSFHVMPNFVKRAEKSFKNDASAILFRNIQRKGYYALDKGYILLADRADPQNELLSGVIVTGMKDGRIDDLITAERAKVKFISRHGDNEVHIIAENTMQWNSTSKEGMFSEYFRFVRRFPSLMADSIKFKTIDDMKRIYDDPMRFEPVRTIAYDTYDYFATELLLDNIRKSLSGQENGVCRFAGNLGFVELRAKNCQIKETKKIELTDDVEVIEYDTDSQILRTSNCQVAILHIEGDELSPTLTLMLNNAKWKHADGSEGFGQQPIRGLLMPQAVDKYLIADVLKAVDADEMKKAFGPSGKPSPTLSGLQRQLQYQINDTKSDIQAEKHSRLVFGIGCLPLIMIGIGLGVIRKGGHLLSAFGVSAVPAAVLIIFIMAGKQLTKNQSVQAENSGIILMWAGVFLLFVLSVVVYRKLLKN